MQDFRLLAGYGDIVTKVSILHYKKGFIAA